MLLLLIVLLLHCCIILELLWQAGKRSIIEEDINININTRILPSTVQEITIKGGRNLSCEDQEDQASRLGRPIVQVFMPGIMPVYWYTPYQVAKLLKNKMFLYLFKKNILI